MIQLSIANDTTAKITSADTAGFKKCSSGNEQLSVVENEVMKIVFTNKGGQLKSVELKNYKSANGKPVDTQRQRLMIKFLQLSIQAPTRLPR